MKRVPWTVRLILTLCVLGPTPPALQAQPALDDAEPTVLTFRPAGQPEPALKYRLLPEPIDQTPGNAALNYHRAIEMLMEASQRQSREERPTANSETASDADTRIREWLEGPLDGISRDEARELIASYGPALREAALGARRSDCDWGLDNRQEGYSLLIPEIQGMRSLARIVALRARLAVLEGEIDEAMHWIQTGYAMARHVGEGPTVIQWLVGVAITGLMTEPLGDLIQRPEAPNLYWAIATRPQPFIELSQPLAGERSMLEQEVPLLRELDGLPWSPAQARVFANELLKLVDVVGDVPGLEAIDDVSSFDVTLKAFSTRFALAGIAAKVAPEAQRSLLAHGFSAEHLDAMPTLQLAGLSTYKEFQGLRDNQFKWLSLPYWEAHAGLERAEKRNQSAAMEAATDNPLLLLFIGTNPAAQSIALAAVRPDRDLAALQCVEAIRLYAGAHDGAFPPNLNAITEAPPPLDPATGEPFQYRVDGSTATLSAPLVPGAPPHPVYLIHYELKRVASDSD